MMSQLKNIFEPWACRFPRLYLAAVLSRHPCNEEKAAYLRLVSRGDTVIEGGANRGVFTALFSHLVGARGRVLAFEPVPRTRAILKERLVSARASNVEVFDYALGERASEAKMKLPGSTDGQASLASHTAGAWAETPAEGVTEFDCRVVALDEIPAARELGRLDFVKLDIEGAELPALKGMRKLLQQHQPTLHLELDPAWTAAFSYTPTDLVRYLMEIGYRGFHRYSRDFEAIQDPEKYAGTLEAGVNIVCRWDGGGGGWRGPGGRRKT